MVVPMILQMLVTNFVSMLDNIMLGRVGTEQMSGASIVNQYVFIFIISTFGAVSGPSIFGAQFFGKGDSKGQMYTFRFRLLVCLIIAVIAALLFYFFDDELISLFLSKDDSPEQTAATLGYGKTYMSIMILSLVPNAVRQAYASVVSECGETKIPMAASMTAVAVNLVLDYGLIFGRLGMPELGVTGAAIATVAAKIVEAAVIVVWVHTHPARNRYAKGAYSGFGIPSHLAGSMLVKGVPLLINEFLWAAGMSVIAQCYSVRGLDVVAARNISTTLTNLFSTVYVQLGACIAIIVGAKLGANKLRDARDTDNKLLFFSIAASVVVGVLILPLAKLFPMVYNTSDEVRDIAAYMIMITACVFPLWSYTNACYFTLRSGGKTGITFLFDFGFTWLLVIPLALVLAYLTELPIRPLFAIINFAEIVKVIIGYFMVRSDIWINNIVNDK
ncbi:MAG: MATE family efflux transporter [Ruminococcus sp.]|nr:MATE family efflux transporter [Ruminococcus sp.]